jgi:hypothetical protein
MTGITDVAVDEHSLAVANHLRMGIILEVSVLCLAWDSLPDCLIKGFYATFFVTSESLLEVRHSLIVLLFVSIWR